MSEVDDVLAMIDSSKDAAVIDAFEALAPYVEATAPDTPAPIMDIWVSLHRLLPETYIKLKQRSATP